MSILLDLKSHIDYIYCTNVKFQSGGGHTTEVNILKFLGHIACTTCRLCSICRTATAYTCCDEPFASTSTSLHEQRVAATHNSRLRQLSSGSGSSIQLVSTTSFTLLLYSRLINIYTCITFRRCTALSLYMQAASARELNTHLFSL